MIKKITKIINNPDQWIITKKGDFVRIKDSEISVDKKLETIRQKLSSSGRFKGKTPEQISKERYDKVWEEVNFDPEKLHDWLYEKKNKNKVEIIKKTELSHHENLEATEAMANFVKKGTKEKWRLRLLGKHTEVLLNEESGQVFYSLPGSIGWIVYKQGLGISAPKIVKPKEKHTATLIFLHGTYGAVNNFHEIEKNFPNTKFIYPNSPTLQYDMWHGSQPAPGGQCKGWINITGDTYEIMETDVLPSNPPRKNFEEADRAIHLDYPQLMRAVSYMDEIIKREIAAGIPSEKIFIAGYSQGGLLTLATALTSQHKLGGFISLCGLLPRWDKLLVKTQDKNKDTPCLIINNTKDVWIPFWTGKKSYDLLKERSYNVEFKTSSGLGHAWKNEDIKQFLVEILQKQETAQSSSGTSTSFTKITQQNLTVQDQTNQTWWAQQSTGVKVTIISGVILGIGLIGGIAWWMSNKKKVKN